MVVVDGDIPIQQHQWLALTDLVVVVVGDILDLVVEMVEMELL
jgi:hypothetical protein